MRILSIFCFLILLCKVSFCQKADSTDHFLRYFNFGIGLVNLNGAVTLDDIKYNNLNSQMLQSNLESYSQENNSHERSFIHLGLGFNIGNRDENKYLSTSKIVFGVKYLMERYSSKHRSINVEAYDTLQSSSGQTYYLEKAETNDLNINNRIDCINFSSVITIDVFPSKSIFNVNLGIGTDLGFTIVHRQNRTLSINKFDVLNESAYHMASFEQKKEEDKNRKNVFTLHYLCFGLNFQPRKSPAYRFYYEFMPGFSINFPDINSKTNYWFVQHQIGVKVDLNKVRDISS